jgi:hypothetical protein
MSAKLPIHEFGIIWTTVSLLLFIGSVALLLWANPEMQKRQVVWLLLMRPVFDTIFGNQVYAILLCLATLAWIFYKRGFELRAAMMIGLFVAIKPTMIFWPAFLLLSGKYRRIGFYSLLTCAAVSLFMLVPYGLETYLQWLTTLKTDQHWREIYNIAIIPLFVRLGLKSAGYVGSSLLILALAVWSARNRHDFAALSGVAICAGILCAPLAWNVYFLWAAPFFTVRRWNWVAITVAIIFTLHPGIPLLFGSWPYLLAVMAALGLFLSYDSKTKEPPLAAANS